MKSTDEDREITAGYKLQAIKDLGMPCELNHGLDPTPASERVSVNNLVIPIGQDFLVYGICQDCQDALLGKDWVLLVCLNCSGTAWRLRLLSSEKIREHPESIMYFSKCAYCGR